MLACDEVSRLVCQSLDARLPLRQRLRVWLHLRMCRLCSQFQRQILFLRKATRRYWKLVENDEALAGLGLSADARERIKRSLKP
jgi:hypothetical protein